MQVLFASSELYPHARTGGLGDVCTALTKSLIGLGIDTRVVMPLYGRLKPVLRDLEELADLGPAFGFSHARILTGRAEGVHTPLFLIECDDLFATPGGMYEEIPAGDPRLNAQRFALLSWAAAWLSSDDSPSPWRPDLLHLNDWHTSLAPRFSWRYEGRRIPKLLTIHNLGFQGIFWRGFLEPFGCAGDDFAQPRFEGGDHVSFLEDGLRHADRIVAVSPTYAREITGHEMGFGLEGLLRDRSGELSGILNGVDYDIWNTASDPWLPVNTRKIDTAFKARCKREAQARFGLPEDDQAMLFAFSNRLTLQKMIDTVLETIPRFAGHRVQFAIIGQGQPEFETAAHALAAAHPAQVAVRTTFVPELEHVLLAGSDACLSPARYEPCGLNPLYAMRYGSVPITRPTGGLVDSIVDATLPAIMNASANGLVFEGEGADDLQAAIERAIDLRGQEMLWRKLRQNCTKQNFGWDYAASRYVSLYESMLGWAVMPLRSVPKVSVAC